MSRLGLALLAGASVMVSACPAMAAPGYWQLDTTHITKPLKGMFAADFATVPYVPVSANVSFDGIVFDSIAIPTGTSAYVYLYQAGPGGDATGQPAISIFAASDFAAAPAAGGTDKNITTRSTTCANPTCTLLTAGGLSDNTLGRIVRGFATNPFAVPTLSEWAIILMGSLLAGGAALALYRRRSAPGVRFTA